MNIRYKPWKSSELENVVSAFFHDLETSNFALTYDLIPHSIDMCYYATKFNRMNVLRWCRLKKPSIPRFRAPLPWDFKAIVLAANYKRNRSFPRPNDKIGNDRMLKFMKSTHYYGKCPKTLCTTMVECTSRDVLSYLDCNYVQIANVTDYGTEISKDCALPVIMRRRGLRLINQVRPKPDTFDDDEDFISPPDMRQTYPFFNNEEISHLNRIIVFGHPGPIGYVGPKPAEKVSPKRGFIKINPKISKYPKRRMDRYQKMQRRHNTRCNK